jgi:histidine triad (HIT) family protein
VYCAIIRGDEPSSRVYEDERVVAFLTRRPTRPGELLVIPKNHVDHFTDVDESVAGHMMICAHRLGRVLQRELTPRRVGFVISGFGLPHAHLIVLPLHEDQDISSARFARVENGEIRYSESNVAEWSTEELDRMAERLRQGLSKGR